MKQKRIVNGVSKIIAVASGKGGVGKSMVAAHLAVALARKGFSVGLLDADIYGPSVPIMFSINAKAKFKDNMIIPEEKYGIKISSIGFLVDPDTAVIWRGPMITKMLYQLLSMTLWSPIDFLIVDTPPGTGDMHLSLAENYNIDGAVIVSTPQALAVADAAKALDMFIKLNIPVIGIVENMSYITLQNSSERHYIFGKDGALKYAEKKGIKLIEQIPILTELSESGGAITEEVLSYFTKIVDNVDKLLLK